MEKDNDLNFMEDDRKVDLDEVYKKLGQKAAELSEQEEKEPADAFSPTTPRPRVRPMTPGVRPGEGGRAPVEPKKRVQLGVGTKALLGKIGDKMRGASDAIGEKLKDPKFQEKLKSVGAYISAEDDDEENAVQLRKQITKMMMSEEGGLPADDMALVIDEAVKFETSRRVKLRASLDEDELSPKQIIAIRNETLAFVEDFDPQEFKVKQKDKKLNGVASDIFLRMANLPLDVKEQLAGLSLEEIDAVLGTMGFSVSDFVSPLETPRTRSAAPQSEQGDEDIYPDVCGRGI